MQKKNFGDSIEFEYDIEDTDFCVPPFSIQTSVENALKHGLRSKVMENGRLSICTYKKGNAHIIEIKDNGVGFDTSILDDSSLDTCIGIKNTKHRLHLMCNGTIDIKSEIGKGTSVTIRIPEV